MQRPRKRPGARTRGQPGRPPPRHGRPALPALARAPGRLHPTLPDRVRVPALPSHTLAPSPGRWLWTCRAGFEPHLFEELAWARAAPRLLGEALVESEGAPGLAPAFARFGMRVLGSWEVGAPEALATAAARPLAALPGAPRLCVQAFTPDTPAGNAQAPLAEALRAGVEAQLPAGQRLAEAWRAREEGALLASLCLAPGRLVLGTVPAREALSLAPGGRARMRRDAAAPSRAALKLEEALTALSLEPGPGEVCVDLGAAPGGWTQRLVARGARVLAVDPARLLPALSGHPRVTHVQQSAFAFEPGEPVDWLFCDMAWRPLEVAQLLAKWGRRGWADHLVANIKLPMKDKNPILWRVRHTLAQEGGWRELRVRQLYHDRDEVTVTARRR